MISGCSPSCGLLLGLATVPNKVATEVIAGCNIDNLNAVCTLCGLEILYTITTVTRMPRISYVFDAFDRTQKIYDEMGRAIPYNEIRPNRHMRLTSVERPTTYQPATFVQEKSVAYLEGVVYIQELGRPPRVQLSGAPDDFLPNLLRRIQDSGGGV